MKLAVKILIFFFGSIVLVIISALVFHDSLISFVLKKVITDKSGGKVELTLESFQLDFESGLILIEKPLLSFSEVYMNETKSIKLNSIAYEKIELDRLDLRALILDREINSERFLLDKPLFKLSEQDSETKSSFHPDKLLSLLNANPDMFSRLNLKVGEIEIHYGSIMLSEFTTPDVDPGLVDFTIIFEDFDTRPIDSTNENRFFFSNEFKFKLKNLHRELKSGYILDIDSALFSSKHNDLIIGGVSLQPYFRYLDQNSVGIKAGKLVLHDISIEEVRGLEDLSLRSVVLEDGDFVNFVNVDSQQKYDTVKSSGLNQLALLLYDFRLDTMMINNFNYFNVKDFSDTLILADDINFMLTGVHVDSGMFAHLFSNINYDEIRFNTGKFSLSGIIPDLKIGYNGLAYTNINRELSVKGIEIHSDTSAGHENFINLEVPELSINGASFSHFQKGKRQNLSVILHNPKGEINLDHLKKDTTKSKKPKKSIADYLTLDLVKIVGGDFNIQKTDEFSVQVKGLGIDLNGIDLRHLERDSIHYESLGFGFANIETSLYKQNLRFSSGRMDYNKPEFSIRDISVAKSASNGSGQLDINRVSLSGFNFEKLVFENELHTGQLSIDSPVLITDFIFEDKAQNPEEKKPFREITIPYSILSDGVSITDGKIDGKFILKEDEYRLKTDYSFGLGEINVEKEDLLIDLLERLGWKLDFSNIRASGAEHELRIDKLSSDKFNSVFQIDKIEVSGEDTVSSDKLKIRSIDLPLFKLTGLNYSLLLNEDSLAIKSIILDNPYVDIVLPAKKDKSKAKPKEVIDLREYLLFSYDTAIINNLMVNLEIPGDSSNANIKLNQLNFGHHFASSYELNLIEHLDLSFKSFSYADSLHDKYLIIHDGYVDPIKKSLKIRGISARNISEDKEARARNEAAGIQFLSKEIEFSNIRLKESLPSGILIDKISFGHLDLDVNQVKKESSEKTDFKINLEMMKRFTKIMTRLRVDTTEIGEINVNIHSMNDQGGHTIQFDSIGLIIDRINIDSSMIDDDDPILIRNLIVDLKGKTRITKDSLYELQTGRLHYNFPERRVTIDSFYVVPRYPDSVFFGKAVYQTDRLNIFGRKVEVNDIYIEEILNNNYFHCGSVAIHNLNADIFRDKRYPIKPDVFKTLPREQLMGLKSLIAIDSINIIDSYVKYSEHDLKSDQPGRIFISNVNGSVYNLTNKLKPGERKNLELNLNGQIMGEAGMEAKVYFPLHPDSITYWLTVKTETIDLPQLNSMTEHLLGIGILRGEGSVESQLIYANDSIARGDLIFKYKKLKLAMYSRKKAKLNQGFISPIISFLINDLVVKSNNPKFARKPRVGQVYFVRDTEKGVVNYLWKGILTGLTSTLGFNNKEQRLERKEDKKANEKQTRKEKRKEARKRK